MASDIYMPLLGMTMIEGTVSRWLKVEGEAVRKGEFVAEIETDKATVELEAPCDGVLGPLLIGEGSAVPVGTILCYVLAPGESLLAAAPPAQSERVESAGEALAGEQIPSSEAPPRRFASPLARRMAAASGVDLGLVEASGPQGRVVAADIRWYLDQHAAQTDPLEPAPPAEPASNIPETAPPPLSADSAADGVSAAPATVLSGVRRVIAERMLASQQATAPVTLVLDAEATELVRWREALQHDGARVSYTDLLLVVVARALSEYPTMQTQLRADNQLHQPAQINIGIAVDTPRGLLVPVLRDLERKEPLQIARETQELIARARAGCLLPDEMREGTFTISNLGMYEIDAFTPIINLPESAILGVGAIAERAVVREGQLCARRMLTLSLTFDHRISDGAEAARFLQRVKHLIQQPLRLLR